MYPYFNKTFIIKHCFLLRLRNNYQGLEAPVERDENYFDAGAKWSESQANPINLKSFKFY